MVGLFFSRFGIASAYSKGYPLLGIFQAMLDAAAVVDLVEAQPGAGDQRAHDDEHPVDMRMIRFAVEDVGGKPMIKNLQSDKTTKDRQKSQNLLGIQAEHGPGHPRSQRLCPRC